MNYLQEKLKQAKYFIQRNTPPTILGNGDEIDKVDIQKIEIDGEESDNVDGCHHFTMLTENSLEAVIEKGKRTLANKNKPKKGLKGLLARFMPQAEEGDTPNIIVDVYVCHYSAKEDGTFGKEKISEEQCITGVRSLHDFYRNQGVQNNEDNVDSGVNFGMGDIHYINGYQEWGQEWDDYGIAYTSSSNGIRPSTVIARCKSIAGTTGDGSRYAIILYPKLTGSTAYGFAWVGTSATSGIHGSFVRTIRFGDSRYKNPETPNFYGGFYHNGTAIHEVGHSLFGLYHTFHNTEGCPLVHGPTEGDRVNDTKPHQKGFSCGYANTENPHNNIMSYSYHTRRVAVTQGQVERGMAVIVNRSPLTFSNPEYVWGDAEIHGCTDPHALNFDSSANVDDGSCIYGKWGCIDPNYQGYDPEATHMKFEMCGLPHVDGCTNPEATNYNSEATRDDGSCILPNPPDEPTYHEDRLGLVDAAHNFTFVAPSGFIGELFAVRNANGIEIPIVFDECGNNNLPCVAAKMLNGDVYTLSSITCTITGKKYEQDDIPLLIQDDKLCLNPENGGLRINGIIWTDYFMSMLGYQVKPQSNIMTYAAKRNGWKPSLFIALTRNTNDGNIIFDNTGNNRQNSDTPIPINKFFDMSMARDIGMYLNGEKILDKGSVTEVVNTHLLSVGDDYQTENRDCGAYIFEVTISKQSPTDSVLKDFVYSRKVDYDI